MAATEQPEIFWFYKKPISKWEKLVLLVVMPVYRFGRLIVYRLIVVQRYKHRPQHLHVCIV